jgi:endonuclease YncB( thermonuclease family)
MCRKILAAGVIVMLLSVGVLEAAEKPHPVPKGQTVTGRCVGVHDGDSMTVLIDGNRQVKVRLDSIDAPELGQAFSRRSREALAAIVMDKECRVESLGPDKYQRTLGRVMVDGQDVNGWLVESGWAWHYDRFDDRKSMADKQAAAREAGRGLWADARPIPPWDWRKMSKEERAPHREPAAAK